ncbi:hypothetical protein [Candidatus Poriferisodalis sp.]|uniref:hypothetical protein n=1 Tax=Candidatus Poriferisodalis sp. TaxID=3101277 RepID=UPI003B016E43
MNTTALADPSSELPVAQTMAEPPRMRRCSRARDEAGATASLELLALTPLLALLVLFVLWTGNSARAGLVADLAAEEAAIAAALCCDDAGPPAGAGSPDASLQREYMAEAVVASRPGLDYLCLGGPRPEGDRGFVTETDASFAGAPAPTGFAHSARVIEVHFVCETDGAVAPLRGLFPTVTMRGRASELTVFADGPRLTIAPVTVMEGDEIVLVAKLNEATTDDIELAYFTEDRTATSNAESPEPTDLDFDAIPEDLGLLATIPAGETTAEMRITTRDDQVCEGDETLALIVSANGPTLPPSMDAVDGIRFTAIATITDQADCPVQPDQ